MEEETSEKFQWLKFEMAFMTAALRLEHVTSFSFSVADPEKLAHLYQNDWQHAGTGWIHQVHVVVNQGLPAAAAVQVELLRVVVVAEVGIVVGQVVLQAGPRGGGVAAAVRNAVQQVAAVHVAPDTTGRRRGGDRNKGKRRRQWVEM